MQLDLIDEVQVSMFPYVAGEGTACSTVFRPTDSTWSQPASNDGVVELKYRRHR